MKYPNNYNPELVYYHVHSMLSNGVTNIDSVTDYHDEVEKIAGFGCKAMAISEHGNTFGWYKNQLLNHRHSKLKYHHIWLILLSEEQDHLTSRHVT